VWCQFLSSGFLLAHLLTSFQHHRRIYTLDWQVHHAEQESLAGFGKWLQRKWHHASVKRAEADNIVRKLNA
jgi:capsule polysaccharide modification protein KpsS